MSTSNVTITIGEAIRDPDHPNRIRVKLNGTGWLLRWAIEECSQPASIYHHIAKRVPQVIPALAVVLGLLATVVLGIFGPSWACGLAILVTFAALRVIERY
ncbi:MAG: hypothetical protein ACTHU0_21835 [Kofleriaceae bacterium]